ncbi:MAG: CYTH domain-containing protein [Candidatus Paceibacterota bacterium]
MSHKYEVEIKSLLGSREKAAIFRTKLKDRFPDVKLLSKGKQLNHYFHAPEEMNKLSGVIRPLISNKKIVSFDKIITEGKKVSIRTRDADGLVLFILKASVGDDSSSNGVKRIEFEEVVPMKLDELDKLLIEVGCSYQAKWSREREEYEVGGTHICLDKNAGYGYLAEFEKVVDDGESLDKVKEEILDFMKKCEVVELDQDRLERMFAYYNSHWSEYYGTEKTFIID